MPHKNKGTELLDIIKRYTEGKATTEEIHFLELYYENFDHQPNLLETKSAEERTAIGEDMRVKIMGGTVFNDKGRGKIISIASKRWYKVAAAASVILLIIAGMYFLKPTDSKEIAKNTMQLKQLNNDVAPGGNKAVLTLANGATIILDSAQNGTLSSQGNIKIIKLNDGQLAYNKTAEENKTEVLYNTISTPKGGQYQLTLSDGSKVWLNAESSLRFPAAFSGGKRKVELMGEAYFEVAHDASKPFRVTVKGVEVQVLGTHFNINAYDDENSIKTTLLEGSVKVSKGNESALIVPGEQARVSNLSDIITVKKDVNLDAEVAWKNGLFDFENDNLPYIMRQLSRWYDVDIVYGNNIPKGHYVGSIRKQSNISEVLKMLELAGDVQFSIVDKKILVKGN